VGDEWDMSERLILSQGWQFCNENHVSFFFERKSCFNQTGKFYILYLVQFNDYDTGHA
jgi:hypothetical protein